MCKINLGMTFKIIVFNFSSKKKMHSKEFEAPFIFFFKYIVDKNTLVLVFVDLLNINSSNLHFLSIDSFVNKQISSVLQCNIEYAVEGPREIPEKSEDLSDVLYKISASFHNVISLLKLLVSQVFDTYEVGKSL